MKENNKRFTIDWNKEEDGTINNIMVLDHSKPDTNIDCPYSCIAMYDSSDIAMQEYGQSILVSGLE